MQFSDSASDTLELRSKIFKCRPHLATGRGPNGTDKAKAALALALSLTLPFLGRCPFLLSVVEIRIQVIQVLDARGFQAVSL